MGPCCRRGPRGGDVVGRAGENDPTQGVVAIKDFGLMLAVAGGAYVLLAVPAALTGGTDFDVTGPAWLACLLPGLAVVLLMGRTKSADPIIRTGIVLALGMVRLVLTLGVAGFTYYLLRHLRGQELGYVLWTTVCYLFLLAVETAIVYRQEMSSQKTGQAL